MMGLVEAIESLILDPEKSMTFHCIEEYNAGLQNAITVVKEFLDAEG